MTTLKAGLQTGLQQSLVMTPKLQQAIKLLQLSALEISSEIEPYILENPLLELDDGLIEGDQYKESTPNDLDLSDQDLWDPSCDIPNIDMYNNDYEYDDLLNKSEVDDLRTHVGKYIGLLFNDNQDIIIASRLLDGLDASGYLIDNLNDIAAQLGTDLNTVEIVLKLLQTIEPAGLFARSLAECLELQLRDRNRFDPYMEKLITHLDDLGGQHYDKLMKWCAVTRDELKSLVQEIKTLNPRPASCFTFETVATMVPDAIASKDQNGIWQIQLNPDAFPKVIFQQQEYLKLKQKLIKREDKASLTNYRGNADWLIKALTQRTESIFKVASEIIKQQQDFLNHGIVYLKPMALRDVAAKTQLHESTISRVTTQKFIATPRGTFEMKYFFGQGISNAIGTNYSVKYIKERISQHIKNETLTNVMSDDAIVEALKLEGIDAARRTVAKYRESMNIPSSSARRRGLRGSL